MYQLAIFLLVMAAYFALKLFIFKDLMPTGYYRKVDRGTLAGLGDVLEAIRTYQEFIVSIAGIMVIALFNKLRQKSFGPLENHSLIPLLISDRIVE